MASYFLKPVSPKQKKRFAHFLAAGEEPVFITGISNRYFWIHSLFYFLLSFLIIGLPKLSALVRKKQATTYVLTSRRFLIIKGIFSRKIVTAPLDRITHVTVEQSMTERFLFNSGQLVIITAGFDQREIVIENVGDPVRFKILMEELTAKIEKSTQREEKPDQKEEKPQEARFKLRHLRI